MNTIGKMRNQTVEFQLAVAGCSDSWVPACGGTETPFKARSGATLLYCYNPATRLHAYLHVDCDIILSDEDARAHLQTW
jgi:hypothetical protein